MEALIPSENRLTKRLPKLAYAVTLVSAWLLAAWQTCSLWQARQLRNELELELNWVLSAVIDHSWWGVLIAAAAAACAWLLGARNKLSGIFILLPLCIALACYFIRYHVFAAVVYELSP